MALKKLFVWMDDEWFGNINIQILCHIFTCICLTICAMPWFMSWNKYVQTHMCTHIQTRIKTDLDQQMYIVQREQIFVCTSDHRKKKHFDASIRFINDWMGFKWCLHGAFIDLK